MRLLKVCDTNDSAIKSFTLWCLALIKQYLALKYYQRYRNFQEGCWKYFVKRNIDTFWILLFNYCKSLRWGCLFMNQVVEFRLKMEVDRSWSRIFYLSCILLCFMFSLSILAHGVYMKFIKSTVFLTYKTLFRCLNLELSLQEAWLKWPKPRKI